MESFKSFAWLRTNLADGLSTRFNESRSLISDVLKTLLGFTQKENNTNANSKKTDEKIVKKLFGAHDGKSTTSLDGRFKSQDGNKSALKINFNIGAATTTPTATSKNAIGRSPFLYRAQYSQDHYVEQLVKAHSNNELSNSRQLKNNNNDENIPCKFTKSPVHELNKSGRLIPDLVGGRGRNGNIHHVIIESHIQDELRIDYTGDLVKKIKVYLLGTLTQSLEVIKDCRHLCDNIFFPGSPNINYNNVHSAFGILRDTNPNLPESQKGVINKILNELKLQTERLLHLDISEISMDTFMGEILLREPPQNNFGNEQKWNLRKFDVRKRLHELMTTVRGMVDLCAGVDSSMVSFVDEYRTAYSIFFPPSEKVEFGRHNQKYLDRIWKSRNSFEKSRRIDDVFGTTDLDYEIIIATFLRIMDKDSQNILYVTDLATLKNTRKKIGKRNFIIGVVREEASQHAYRRHNSTIPHYNVFKADGHVVTRYSIPEGENNVFEALVFVILLCFKHKVRSRDSSCMMKCMGMFKNIFTRFSFVNFNELRKELLDEGTFDEEEKEVNGDDNTDDDD